MTTTSHRRDTLADIGNTRDTLSQAAAEGEVQRGKRAAWQMQALERAGDLAMDAHLVESRAMAEGAR